MSRSQMETFWGSVKLKGAKVDSLIRFFFDCYFLNNNVCCLVLKRLQISGFNIERSAPVSIRSLVMLNRILEFTERRGLTESSVQGSSELD